MLLYSAQALSLGILLWCLTLSRRGNDVFIGVYVCLWTVGVIALYWHFREAQDVFYSNDQRIQVHMVQQIATDGIKYSLDRAIGFRYVVTIPALLLTRCGIDPLLALKFLQAIFFILTYRLVLDHFRRENLKFKPWYLVLFTGPIFILMSMLGLRDLALAYFSLYTLLGPHSEIRGISWLAVFLLRPHLAVALVFGRLFSFVFRRVRSDLQFVFLPIVAVCSFISGTYSYVIGAHIQSRTNFDFSTAFHLFSQDGLVRFFANFGGLQFLLLGKQVEFSVVSLFLLRLVFVDTFLIPCFFIWFAFTGSKLRTQSVFIFSGFAFFLGLSAHTDFNSSRQNIPFLVLMGVTVAEHLAIEHREKSLKGLEKPAIAVLDSNQPPTPV